MGRRQQSGRWVGVSSRAIASVRAVEALERRRLLHAGHDHAADAVAGVHDHEPVYSLSHIPEAEFRAAHPQFNGLNLWSPATFNPTNSPRREDWLYDPHQIEVAPGTEAPLPDADVREPIAFNPN